MSAGKYDIRLEQGSDFSMDVYIKDTDGNAVDLTGYSAALRVSNDRDTSPDFTLTGGSGLTIGTTDGKIQVDITDTQVDALTWDKGEFDLVTTDGSGTKKRRLSGSVFVSEEVPTS